ncbi:uncharacterized protein LOC116562624 [Sapajus apella]|uniref:Uncharacterized protein LOC116562624 n=1 Tax=Sapajus apella TaxID=9515 RepID=A0A6J3J8E2_SAPAP|nr:uncharacterized protein LOC116562624 [Sapajus apella]
MGRGCGARRESGPRPPPDSGTGAWSGLGAAVTAAIFGEHHPPPAPRRNRETEKGGDPKRARNKARGGQKEAAGERNRPKGASRGRCPRPPGNPAPSLLPSPLLPSSRRPGRLRGSGPAGTFSASERPPARPPAARPRGGSEGCALRARPGRAASPPAPTSGPRHPRAGPRLMPGRRPREPPQAARARDETSLRLRQCASSGARAARPQPRPVPLCPSLSLPGSDLRRPRGLEGTGSAAGAAERPGPRSTLRKLVFLRSAPRAGYIVFLRWTGEVAANLPSPPDSGRARLVPAARWREAGGGEGVGEWRRGGGGCLPLPLPKRPCPCAQSWTPLLGVGAGRRGPDPFRAGPR